LRLRHWRTPPLGSFLAHKFKKYGIMLNLSFTIFEVCNWLKALIVDWISPNASLDHWLLDGSKNSRLYGPCYVVLWCRLSGFHAIVRSLLNTFGLLVYFIRFFLAFLFHSSFFIVQPLWLGCVVLCLFLMQWLVPFVIC